MKSCFFFRTKTAKLAWASAQIHCQCTTSESRVVLPQTSQLTTADVSLTAAETSFVPSRGRGTVAFTLLSFHPIYDKLVLISQDLLYSVNKLLINKKVLLRERKRHTARRVVSTHSVVLSWLTPPPPPHWLDLTHPPPAGWT